MTAPPPRRPWHRRKRTWAAVAAWSVAAYLLSPAAVGYFFGRGWLPDAVIMGTDPAYLPVSGVLSAIPGTFRGKAAVGWWREWNSRWLELGQRHRNAALD